MRRNGVIASALVVIALHVDARVAAGQRWRTVDVSRQSDGQTAARVTAARVTVRYAAGKLELKPATSPNTLYSMSLKYDAERAEPISVWDSSARHLELGVRIRGSQHWSGHDDAGRHDPGFTHQPSRSG